MIVYYVYEAQIDTSITGDPVVSVHSTEEGAKAKIKKLEDEFMAQYGCRHEGFYDYSFPSVEE